MFGGNFSLLHQMTSIVTTIFINNLDFLKNHSLEKENHSFTCIQTKLAHGGSVPI